MYDDDATSGVVVITVIFGAIVLLALATIKVKSDVSVANSLEKIANRRNTLVCQNVNRKNKNIGPIECHLE